MAMAASGNLITAELANLPAWLGEIIKGAYPSRRQPNSCTPN